MLSTKKTDKEIKQEEYAKKRVAVGRLGAFYRSNPHRLAKDYLNVSLFWFQKVLIYAMMKHDHFMFFGTRSIGKTWLTALFCVIRCILFPGTKVVIAAGTKRQAGEVLDKIVDDFMKNYDWGSNNLRKEILDVQKNSTDHKISFHNGSWIKAVTSTDNARGERANLLILDEFRMIDESILKTVLKKFLGTPRMPLFLNKKEYKNNIKYKEVNKEIYMSSAWYVTHWSYKKAIGFFKNMYKGASYFICGLPYQLPIREGLLLPNAVIDEMSEPDFDQTTFDIEMGCMFYGDANGSFFKNEDITKNRTLFNALPSIEKILAEPTLVPRLEDNERRILSVDVALLASKKNKDNDASSIQINRAQLKNGHYIANLVFLENHEGLLAQDLAKIVIRYFYEYNCTDIVLDMAGVGQSIYDLITDDYFDEETGKLYEGVSCCNDKDMAERCKKENAQEVVWSVKANPAFNNDICIKLRGGLQTGNIKLLAEDFKAQLYLSNKTKGYSKLSPSEQSKLLIPFKQTTLMLHELISLKSEVVNGNRIKVKETSGMRKDRYSSLAYNYYIMREIDKQLKPEREDNTDYEDLPFRQPSIGESDYYY